jgi:hypothetical protein
MSSLRVRLNIRLTNLGRIVYAKDMAVVHASLWNVLSDKAKITKHTTIGKFSKTSETPLYRISSIKGERVMVFPLFFKLEDIVTKLMAGGEDEKTRHPGVEFTYSYVPHVVNKIGLTFKTPIVPTPNQKVMLDYLKTNVYTPAQIERGAGCVLVAGTGDGKTWLGGAMIAWWNVRTLVVVTGKVCAGEWFSMFERCGVEVGQYGGGKKEIREITVITMASLSTNAITVPWSDAKLSTADFAKTFDAIVFDEVHNYPTDKWTTGLAGTNRPIKLGLTATPNERLDGKDPLIEAHVGPYVFGTDLPGFEADEIEWKCDVTCVEYYGPAKYTKSTRSEKTGMTISSETCKMLESDPERNDIIVRYTKELLAEGRYIYIFCEHKKYPDILRDILLIAGIDSVAILRGGFDDDYKAIMERVIIGTYGYCLESLSKKERTAIICATPRMNRIRQMIGRITRRDGDPTIVRRIIDIRDMKTGKAKQYPSREEIYLSKQFNIEYVKLVRKGSATDIEEDG